MFFLKRKALGWVVIGVLFLGAVWPAVGWVVPIVVALNITAALFAGRYGCGHLCPRGQFLSWLPNAGGELPGWVRRAWARWSVLVLLFGGLFWRLASVWPDPVSLGGVFWVMCLVTTAAALLLAGRYFPRAWCALCPVGTMGQALARRQPPYLELSEEACRSCGLCTRRCPLHLPPGGTKDCLHCDLCVAACPFGALSARPSPGGRGHSQGVGIK